MMSINKWKWTSTGMGKRRTQPTAAFIDEDKLICCGGAGGYYYVDFYNFNTKKWKQLADLQRSSVNSGICTNKSLKKEKERVYVGGGSRGKYQSMQFYNIEKNEWYLLPDTNGEHKYHPILWFDDENVLYIISAWCNMMECIDLRENKWTVHVGPNRDKTFEKIFGETVCTYSYRTRMCI